MTLPYEMQYILEEIFANFTIKNSLIILNYKNF